MAIHNRENLYAFATAGFANLLNRLDDFENGSNGRVRGGKAVATF
jgi:hypothetical protein